MATDVLPAWQSATSFQSGFIKIQILFSGNKWKEVNVPELFCSYISTLFIFYSGM